jgi:hypothetical protein
MRRKARSVIYVCSAIKENNLISKMIESSSIEESYSIFEKDNGIKPQVVLGPFFKKKTGILNKNFDIKFKFGQNKQGIYNGWHVTAMPLLNPEDSVYLLYNKRIDGQKVQKPQAMVVKTKEIQDLK